MKKLELLYEAFLKYRLLTKNNPALINNRNTIKNNNPENDKFIVKKSKVIIDNDWINEIESNLIYIEKALDQERQFIRTNSEVVEIEKVKRIGKESIVDLAKHSQYITKEQEDDNIIPDKILMVEKLSDYAVYENRFLYMLITYIRTFIDFRLENIQKTRKMYESNFCLKKEIKDSERTFNFNVEFNDYRTNNGFPIEDEDTDNKIKRLNNINEILESYLKRQIMVDVSKTPMVKPPITKTNVLKNDNNFKRALALFDYLNDYNTPGFEIKKIEYNFAPFDSVIADDFAELYSITNYLCYTYGNNLQSTLTNRYELKKAREKHEAEVRFLKQIERLKKEIELEGSDVYSYMLMLEQRMKMLDDKLIDYNKAILDKQTLFEQNEKLNQNIFTLEAQIDKLKAEATERERQFNDEIFALDEKHKDDLFNVQQEFNDKICALNLDIDDLKANIRQIQDEREQKIKEIENEFNDKRFVLINEYEEKRMLLDKEAEEMNAEMKDLKEELSKVSAMHLAYLVSDHKVTGDFTSKEKFNELERVFLEFSKFFKANFEKTKKEIKKELFWYDKQNI